MGVTLSNYEEDMELTKFPHPCNTCHYRYCRQKREYKCEDCDEIYRQDQKAFDNDEEPF